MIAVNDGRAIALARDAVSDAQTHVAHASTAVRVAHDGPVVDVAEALAAAQQSLGAAWETLAYIDQMLAAAVVTR
jgi:flagellar hook-basal body complex protein FliE